MIEKTIRGFFSEMKISRFLFYLFVSFSVLNIKSVQNEELVDIQSWAGFQGLNVLSVGAVANDCKKIFDTCRADSQKIIDDLSNVVESTQDAAVVPPKLWEALGRITDILQNAPKNVRFHFAELGDHFLKKLNSAISVAKSKNFGKLQDLQSIYDSGVDPTNESVLELEKSFSINYNPNSILQQTVPESINQASYSQSVAMYELKHLSTAVTEEIDNIEKAALKLLNRIYRGITMAKEVAFAVKKTGAYPTKYDEQCIRENLQNCSFLAKTLKPDGTSNNPVSQPVSTAPAEPDSDTDPVIPSLSDETPGGDESGCGEIFRKSEKKIMQQLIITIKEIKPINDRKEIDSRMFQVFKNYSLVLSNLSKKIITNVITVVNQFFQLYNIVLSILDKINPDMKSKAEDLLYLQDIDTSDAHYENVNKYIVEDYLSSSKMNELLERIDSHVKSMKSLSEVKKAIIQELSVITNELGIDLQTMKSTILYVFEELKKGVKALQNLKNKSNRTGFRYYLNFYRGKADLAQLKKLISIINSLKIELLLERQLFTDDEELEAFKSATSDVQNEIDQKNQKLLEQLNTMNDFNFVQGFVSKSVLDYNMCLETYTVQSRTILKKVITKYVTIFEELIIIIKRRKIKNAKTIEDLYSNESSTSSHQDETVSKYLLEKTDIDIEQLCSTLNQEISIQNKETVTQEIRELSTVTHSEVTKINQTVLKLINTMSTEIQNLKTIKDEASQNLDYEISDDKLKCISSIIQMIESLHIKSNKDEIQSLSIYFERVKEKIQMATQNFETQTSECVEMQQFKSQVETLKTSIFEALTQASLAINDKIRRVIFEYNEKLYILQQNSSYSELSNLQDQESSFTLNDNTRKYVTGYYTSEEVFTSLDTIMNSATSSDISQVKTDMYAKLDETNESIESELLKIHDDLNIFVEKFSQGMKVLSDVETKSQKQTDQMETIDEADLAILKEVDGMVKVIGKYVNVNAENSQRELKVQIDNARLQISKQFEQVSETVTSTQDYTQMESIMTQSINSCETIYNELKNNTRSELIRSVEEFLNSYQKTITTLHSQVSTSQTTILQDLNKGDCKTDDNDYQKFMQMMLEQDYQSSTTVSNTFEYMKKYNFVDSQNMKEKCSQVFQSLSNKMNMEIDNISHVSKYVLENVQKANNVLIKLENCENKQNINISLTDEELREFRIARSVNELWKYSSQDTTITSIGTTITNARSEIDLEYRKIQTKLESSTDQSVIQTEIQSSLENIHNIFESTQTQVNEIVKQNVESFYTSMTSEINELQSSGSTTLNTALQSVISNRSISSTSQQQNSSTNVDFNSFTNSVNIQQIYNEIKTKSTENSCQTIESFKQAINEKFSKVEKTSAYVLENVQKGYSVVEEIKNSLKLESNYQLTQYQEEQLRKCVSVSHKIGNLKVDAKTAQTTITNSINSVKNQISEEYTKINESVSTLTDEKSVQETISKGVNKFEQLFAQAKNTVKEQLSLASSGFYSSYMNTMTSLENQNSSQICKTMRDIENGITSYQSSSDQSYVDTTSYFNSKSFKSCLSIKNWFRDIQSTTSFESFSTVNERSTKELSNLNDKITSSFDKMESSSTYVLNSIEKSTELLTQIEESVKQDATYQLSEEQITEFQKCISIYQSIQTVTTTSTYNAQESIQTSISDVKSKISSAYSEITQSISSLTDETAVTEVRSKGVQKFEQIFSEAKETVKEELFQSLNSFYTSFTQISTDSHAEFNEISSTLQNIKSNSNTYQSDEQSYQETLSYFNSETFKSCVTVKNWFNEINTSSSSTTSSNVKESTINEFNGVNEKINSSLDKLETSSSFILQTIESSTQIFKQIETSMIQGSTYQLTQEQITQVQKCMSVYHSVQSTVTSTSTLIAQQTIQSDIANVKEEINSAYSQITQSISSAADDSSVRQVETVGVDNYENIFSHATESIKGQLFQKSSDFHSMFTQLSTDMKQENLQTVVTSENTIQSESDQSFTSMLSCFNNDMFTSTSVIKNWYSEIKASTSESDWSILSGGLSGKVTSDFSTLNERVTKSIDSMQESSTYVLDSIKKGFETIKQAKECMIKDSNYKLTQEQVTFLQKCVTIHQTMKTVMTTTSTTESTKAKQTVESDISNAKSLITEEFNKASETIKSLTDESSINEAATKSINNMDQFFSQTKEKVQSVLADSSSNFYNTYQKISSLVEQQENSQTKQVLSDIMNNKNSYQCENDKSFSSIISYFNDSSYKSTSAIQNWYNEIKSGSSTSESSNYSENTINKLSTLNEQVTKSIDSMQLTSSSVIDTIEKGSKVLKQMEESTTKNSNYQLSQDQVTYLQKCMTIYRTMQSSTTTTTSTTETIKAKQTVESDINNAKSVITDEFNKASETIRSLTDENSINEAATRSINNMDQFFSQTKDKVQSVLSDSSSNFYNTYQKLSSVVEKQENSQIKQVLSDITNNKSSYQCENDQSFSSIISYFNDSSYKSSSVIQNWYNEIKSGSSTSESSNYSENTINKLTTLNEQVTKSIDSMQQNSSSVIDTIEKGSAVLKQIEESATKNSSYQLSQEQVTYLQKCFTIYQTIQCITTTTTSTTVSTAKKSITSDIKDVKSKITDEFTKVSESLKSLTDENNIKQVVSDNVNKVDQCYSETKQKVHAELNQASSDFFNNYQQITSSLDQQDVKTLQDIVTGKNTYQSNSDETYSKMVSYLNSDTFKSKTSMQNWYQEIHSSSSTNQSSTSECAINELSTLNDRVTKSINSMEECSNYVLDTIDKGSQVIKQIQQSTKENTNYHLTETQIIELQKTISIHQIIQSITISSKSTTVTNAEQTITSEVENAKSQINEECKKVTESIRSLSDETSIKKVVDDNVCKVEQYYSHTKDKVQSQLTETSSSFFSNLQSVSSNLNTQSKSETSTMIQEIVEGKNAYQVENDESFKNVVTYLNSDSFKSNQSVKNLYQTIQSDTSASSSTNYSEQAINNLSTFNTNVSKSVDSMEENSKYILDTMKKGSEVIQKIEECTKQDSTYKITQEQVTILQKCITIYQTIQTIVTTTTTTSTTTDVSNNEKDKTDENNVNQNSDTSRSSVVSNVGRSIADAFGMGSETNEKTDNSNKEESTVARDLGVDNKTADLATNQSSTSDQSSTDAMKVINEGDVDTCDSASISNTQQKITTNVSNAKTQINDEFTKTSQSLSSMTDETCIKQAVDENVQKVDNYYVEAKKEVQSQLTQTTSGFYKSCQKISENMKTENNSQSNTALHEIINDKTTYQADDDENFKQVLSYLNSDSFKTSADVKNWYNEIHSSTSTSDLSKQSVDELSNLNGRVTESVDKMENHSKYILDTIKQGSEILKQIEDSSKQNTNFELTQDQIIVLKKCITIYQVIETITTSTTTVTTVSEKNNSVSNHSVASDDEYEYDIEVKKNTKEVVQVEETTQEEKVAVDQKDTANSTSSDISKTHTNDSVNHENSTNETKSLDAQIEGTDLSAKSASNNTAQKVENDASLSQNVQSTTANANEKGVISDSNSTTNESTVSQNEAKKSSKANKIDRLKKFTQEESTCSKTSLTTLMVNWTITKSTTAGIPNTCESLVWDKYFTLDDDDDTIKEISDLLAVGRSVIEDSIELKKEKLPLYRDIHEIGMMVVSCTEIVDEILLQISEVVGQDVQVLKASFSDCLKKNLGPDATKALSDKTPTLDEELLSAASTFFSMKDSKKTDLLNQINKGFNNVQINDEKQAREIATQKFDKLQSIMKTVLDNIDCLVLRVVDTIENAKHSMTCLKNDDNSYIYVKNGQVLCDTVKIPTS